MRYYARQSALPPYYRNSERRQTEYFCVTPFSRCHMIAPVSRTANSLFSLLYRHAFAILLPLLLSPRRDVFRNINVIYFSASFFARFSFYGDVT